ncbi:fructose-6-phosphate aldolase [Anaerosinus massiliensis]|uniref:fructose-6-phosphate aldolase n=1 Tax=Massilibacillus massiliensis TaxID=1806837 RepID=UPI000B2C8171|nr:fructose-6-phosphate aldolase [Massilibacillus massiliensis]
MEYLFDTANLEDIRKYSEIFPITGITSNPSIVKLEGKIEFFQHFKEIRQIIGFDKTLHIQILAENAEDIIAEANTLLSKIDDQIFIKIPVTPQGLKAMRLLKADGVHITATAIYTKMQGLLALEAGADFIAPYVNRMQNLDINAYEVIQTFAKMIEQYHYPAKIVAASFKNMHQVNAAFEYGAQTVTIPPSLLIDAFKMPSIQKAIDDFSADWGKTFGDISITKLK